MQGHNEPAPGNGHMDLHQYQQTPSLWPVIGLKWTSNPNLANEMEGDVFRKAFSTEFLP